MSAIDLQKFADTPLVREPFEYLVVPEFIRAEAQDAVHASYPAIFKPGSFPLARLTYGPGFAALMKQITGPAMRSAFESKFGIELGALPTVVTVRGQCGPKDGSIHTDLPGKIITVLIYLNPSWEDGGGQLRLLRSAHDIDDVIVEVPPVAGTLLAFRRSDNSYHGHKPFVGRRRVVQLNWVTPRHLRSLRRHELRDRVVGLLRHMLPWRKEPTHIETTSKK